MTFLGVVMMFCTSLDDCCSNAARYSCSLSVCSRCEQVDVLERHSIIGYLREINARTKAAKAAKNRLRTTRRACLPCWSINSCPTKDNAAITQGTSLGQMPPESTAAKEKVLRWLDLYTGKRIPQNSGTSMLSIAGRAHNPKQIRP